mgnify:CR=1 FL=1
MRVAVRGGDADVGVRGDLGERGERLGLREGEERAGLRAASGDVDEDERGERLGEAAREARLAAGLRVLEGDEAREDLEEAFELGPFLGLAGPFLTFATVDFLGLADLRLFDEARDEVLEPERERARREAPRPRPGVISSATSRALA